MAGNIGVSSDDIVNLARNLSSNSLFRSITALTTAAAVGTATYYYATRPNPTAYGIDIENQSIVIDEKEGIRASTLCRDGKLVQFSYDDVTTLYEGFQRGMRVSNNGPCLGKRKDGKSPYEWTSYKDVCEMASAFGSCLITQMDQQPVNATLIGIFSSNRHEWVICEQACSMYSMVSVPLYDTLGIEACKFIINQTEMKVVMVDTAGRLDQLLQMLPDTPSIKHLIMLGEISNTQRETAEKNGVTLHAYDDVLRKGREKKVDHVPPHFKDLAVICYTSGTTGNPKGCMISHGALISCVAGSIVAHEKSLEVFRLNSQDVHISYLPLAHMFERSAQAALFMEGGRVGFFRGNIKELMDDVKELRPTVFTAVPRLLTRLYDKVMSTVSGSRVKTRLLEWAIEKKLSETRRGIVRNDSLWDRILFKKIHQSFGGRLKLVLTGSAPVSERVIKLIRAAVGCYVVEGYGQTECTAGVSGTPLGEYRGEVVGPPLPCNYIKLIDVPEMDYFATEGRGEICVKGYNTFSGYFKMPEKTKETIDEDGWVHTGDVGMWTEFGSLRVIDRCKHIFKLAQGEYVAPEKVENIYIQSRHVAQCFVDGNSFRSCVVAIVVPDFETILPELEILGLGNSSKSPTDLAKNAALKDLLFKEMNEQAKIYSLKGFEQAKAITLFPDLFSVENGLLTPTFKSKRTELRRFFASEFQTMYTKLGEA